MMRIVVFYLYYC